MNEELKIHNTQKTRNGRMDKNFQHTFQYAASMRQNPEFKISAVAQNPEWLQL
jgi:hypothetical protein